MNPAQLIECGTCHQQFPPHLFEDAEQCKFCSHDRSPKGVDADLLPFARRTLYNFSSAELSLLLQFLLMHQSLATLLEARWSELERLVYDLEYSSVQQLIKVDVLYWLHHADKQGKKLASTKTLLLKIREVVCDWLGQLPPNPAREYKLRSKQRGELAVACIQRTVPLSMCQVAAFGVCDADDRAELAALRSRRSRLHCRRSEVLSPRNAPPKRRFGPDSGASGADRELLAARLVESSSRAVRLAVVSGNPGASGGAGADVEFPSVAYAAAHSAQLLHEEVSAAAVGAAFTAAHDSERRVSAPAKHHCGGLALNGAGAAHRRFGERFGPHRRAPALQNEQAARGRRSRL